MDYDVWLMCRDQFPGKTYGNARRIYRRVQANKREKGRLGSHVEKGRMRADRAQDAVDEREALVAGAVVHPVREAG
jgi:hypothetical protein